MLQLLVFQFSFKTNMTKEGSVKVCSRQICLWVYINCLLRSFLICNDLISYWAFFICRESYSILHFVSKFTINIDDSRFFFYQDLNIKCDFVELCWRDLYILRVNWHVLIMLSNVFSIFLLLLQLVSPLELTVLWFSSNL